LIKVEAAPLNPSDVYTMAGDYDGDYNDPWVPGNEGSGTVIKSGGGLLAWSLMGKRVGFVKLHDSKGGFTKNGAYAEYIVTSAFQCIALSDETSWEKGACSFVNPVTAIGLLDRCKANNVKAVI
jgi:NADPH:quinone reductase